MNDKITKALLAVGLVGLGAAGTATVGDYRAQAQTQGQVAVPCNCPCAGLMGPGMMGGPGMTGHGMMGPGMMNHGMMGMMGRPANLNLSPDDVRISLERWLAMSGNAAVKVGTVTAKDASTVTAEIVTVDKNEVVQRFSVDRNSGIYRVVQ